MGISPLSAERAAGAVRDGGAVRHPVGAHAVLDLLDRGFGRHRAHLPGFGRIAVRGVHGRLHAALLGYLDVDPVRALGPVFHAEILRRGEIVELGIPIAREADRLAHALRGQVGAVLVMDDRGAVQRLPDRGTAVVGVDDVADRVGGADLHVGLLLVAGGHVQLVIDRRLVLRQHDHAERGVRVGVDRLLCQRVNAARAELVLPRGRGRVLLALIRVVALRLGLPLRLPTVLRVRAHIAAVERTIRQAHVAHRHQTAVRVPLTRIGALALIDRVAQSLVHVHELVLPVRQIGRQTHLRVTQRRLHAIQRGRPRILVDPMHIGRLRRTTARTATVLTGTTATVIGQRYRNQTGQQRRGGGDRRHRTGALLPEPHTKSFPTYDRSAPLREREETGTPEPASSRVPGRKARPQARRPAAGPRKHHQHHPAPGGSAADKRCLGRTTSSWIGAVVSLRL